MMKHNGVRPFDQRGRTLSILEYEAYFVLPPKLPKPFGQFGM